MPGKYRMRRTRRRGGRRRQGRARLTRAVGQFLPPRQIVTLKYSVMVSPNFPTVGALLPTSMYYLLSANDPYIPFQGAGVNNGATIQVNSSTSTPTVQPFGWDTMATLYNRYSVLSSSIKIRMVQKQGTQNALCLLSVEDTINSDPDVTDMLQRPGVAKKWVAPQYPGVTLSKRWNCKAIGDISLNRAPTNSSPGETRFYRIMFSQEFGDPATGGLVNYQNLCEIVIYYKILYSDRLTLATS